MASKAELELRSRDRIEPEQPPAYDESSRSPASASNGPIPGLEVFPSFGNGYMPPNSTLSKDHTTLTVNDPTLMKSPKELLAFLQSSSALPPAPHVRIKASSEEVRIDLLLNVMRYLVPAQAGPLTPRGIDIDRKGLPMGLKPDANLLHILNTFCADQRYDKVLILERSVSHWDTEYLHGKILALISEILSIPLSDIKITFPIFHQKVVIGRERGFLTGLMSIGSAPRTYDALRVAWPYANRGPLDEQDHPSGSVGPRVCLVRSEQAWWNDHKEVIKLAIGQRRRGNVGLDDIINLRLGIANPPQP